MQKLSLAGFKLLTIHSMSLQAATLQSISVHFLNCPVLLNILN